MSSYALERESLKSLVAAVQIGSVNVFEAVYDYEEPDFWNGGMPCAFVVKAPTGSKEEFHSDARSEMNHVWKIRIVIPWQGSAVSEHLLDDTVDATLTKLRSNNSVRLGGNVDYAIVGDHEFAFLSSRDNTASAREATITVIARSLILRTSV